MNIKTKDFKVASTIDPKTKQYTRSAIQLNIDESNQEMSMLLQRYSPLMAKHKFTALFYDGKIVVSSPFVIYRDTTKVTKVTKVTGFFI